MSKKGLRERSLRLRSREIIRWNDSSLNTTRWPTDCVSRESGLSVEPLLERLKFTTASVCPTACRALDRTSDFWAEGVCADYNNAITDKITILRGGYSGPLLLLTGHSGSSIRLMLLRVNC